MTDVTIEKNKPQEQGKQPAQESEEHKEVRPAGPQGAGVDPKEWDKVDEESDESFPASDAPSRY